ncbi:MAG: glutamate--tRNA ligase [Pirellulales bacterium]|nr:glutamate--tRNA ligase [Pirellulales bacterium]
MVRTRFAPSPTGFLHIGGVRTALYNWLFARGCGGQFILRIDDTDQTRHRDEALAPILQGFQWLGLDWDEGPGKEVEGQCYFQSQREERYQQAVEQLLESGHAYRDFATPEELQKEREQAEQEGRATRYSRRWMATSEEQCNRYREEGRGEVVRLKMPSDGELVIPDLIRGDVTFAWAREQDHVIRRADGTCLYHLATVVDDESFEISHVIRAEEHLSNTPRQIFIADALGYKRPQFAHLPYVAEPGSKHKLSKRKLQKYMKDREFARLQGEGEWIARQIHKQIDPEAFNPVLVDFYQSIGFLPDALLNYLLLLGWSLDDSTEIFTREKMIECFSLDRVNKAPASFDPKKLEAFQEKWFHAFDPKKKVALCLPFLQRAGLVAEPPDCSVGPQLLAILDAAGDRVKIAGDILHFADFFIADEALEYEQKPFAKRLGSPNARALLGRLRDRLAELDAFAAEDCEAAVKGFVESEGIKMGEVIHALRVAVTGKAVGLGMFDTLGLLGRDSVLRRISRALEQAESLPAGDVAKGD